MMKTIIMFIIFTIWAVADLSGLRMAFDGFLVLGKSKRRSYGKIWLLYYFAVTYAYCYVKLFGPRTLYDVLFFLFYLKAVPIVWSAYGVNIKVPFIVFLYDELEAVISSATTLVIVFGFREGISEYTWIDDMVASSISVCFFAIMYALLYLRKKQIVDIGLANLSVWKYFLLIMAIFCAGNLETASWYSKYDIRSRIYSVLVMLMVLIMTTLILFINRKNYSMGNVIDILNRQMKDMTGYYQELSDKEKELRKIRHDTRNHLSAISALIESGEKEKAIAYIKDIDGRYQRTTRRYDTGNILADALIGSKENEAERYDTYIEFKGYIPRERINDADLVTLLSNMLDNAVEACQNIKGRTVIEIESKLIKNMWVVTMENPVIAPVEIVMGHIATSKKNKEIHGIGIANMESVVRKYNGSIDFSCKNKVFRVRTGLEL